MPHFLSKLLGSSSPEVEWQARVDKVALENANWRAAQAQGELEEPSPWDPATRDAIFTAKPTEEIESPPTQGPGPFFAKLAQLAGLGNVGQSLDSDQRRMVVDRAFERLDPGTIEELERRMGVDNVNRSENVRSELADVLADPNWYAQLVVRLAAVEQSERSPEFSVKWYAAMKDPVSRDLIKALLNELHRQSKASVSSA